MGEEVEELVKRLTIRARDCESMALDFRDIGGRNADAKADEYTAAFRDFRAAIDIIESLRASLTRVEEERDDLRHSVIAFAAPLAARYAKEFGFAPDELHPAHYDLLEKCGARMDSFKRADLSRADGQKDKAP